MKNYKKFMYVENQDVSTVVSLSALIHNIVFYNNFYFFLYDATFRADGHQNYEQFLSPFLSFDPF